ncbi:MAG: family 78 glycoside hydrolase catalytic domain [Anaerolineae bacterium]|nr:family 78 glycoside hydrolase catalytic domain [Anaerolineae bacterium]
MKLQAIDLRCDDRRNPLGVERNTPHLSWVCQSSKRGEQQIAYQILVASDPENLTEEKADFWNSGRVDSNQTYGIPYNGKPLSSMSLVYWTVRVWGRDGRESNWAQPAQWGMGILSVREWSADWIGAVDESEALLPPGRKYHLHRIGDTPDDPWVKVNPLAKASIEVRKEIFISDGLERAAVYICGLGAFELYMNGSRIGTDVLSPAWTDYDHRCQYLTFDVTRQVLAGRNVVGVVLGNSMYNVVGGRYSKFVGSYGPPKMILQMALTYDDGRLEMFVSDSSWHWRKSPTTFNCIFGGEDYDARLEDSAWLDTGGDLSQWQPVKVVQPPAGKLTSERIEPRTVLREVKPVMVTEPAPGVLVYDLGENIAGRMRIGISGERGTSIRMLPGEMVNNRGFVNQRNMTSGRDDWTIEFNYVVGGKNGRETWAPRFSYTGFRYIQVEYQPALPGGSLPILHELVGEVVGLNIDQAGMFNCSCDNIRSIYRLVFNAMVSNLQSVATDCPHREKLGWLEQLYLMGPSLLYQFDLRNFLRKALVDMRDAQQEQGLVPDIAPEYVIFEDGFRDSPEWGSAVIQSAWQYYQHYPNLALLRKHYRAMRRYLDYLTSKSKDGIISHGLGDWYDFGPGAFGSSQLTSSGITATLVYYENVKILAKVARLLERDQEADELEQLAMTVREQFNRTFLSKERNHYDRNSQTANAMSLTTGVIPVEYRNAVSEQLLLDLQKRKYQVTAGDVGHVYVLRALTEMNRHDVALQAIRRVEGFGYLHQLQMGATTLTEAWDASELSSHNHMMLGHAMEWFYAVLGGLRFDERFPDTHQFIVSPEPVLDIEWASVQHNSVFGMIQIQWALQDGVFSLELTVPINTSALVYLPVESPRFVKESGISVYEIPGSRFVTTENGKCIFEVQSGQYEFSMDWHDKE